MATNFIFVDQLILGNKRCNVIKLPIALSGGEVTITSEDARLSELDYVIPMFSVDSDYAYYMAIGS